MALYAIGDLQGCFEPLARLLKSLRFDRRRDRLLLTGDLVNRGPDSLKCLRFVRELGDAAVTVLGNHDLHLLAAAHTGEFGARDTFDEITRAPDREVLLDWLRQQPLAYEEPHTGILLVHAGLPPQWSKARALRLAREASNYIAGPDAGRFFTRMYGNRPDCWSESLKGIPRLRFTVNCLTRLRYCDARGRIDHRHKGPPGTQAAGLLPWFQVPGRKSARERIVCGHWSSLGQVEWPAERVWALDTGCVWGGCLTALNLETGALTRAGCTRYRRPLESAPAGDDATAAQPPADASAD
jgi:bis(5'-nucleosyl)-tetraphosphatase (symmetrical)